MVSLQKMSLNLNDLVTQIINTAPIGEINEVTRNLSSIVPPSSTTTVSKTVEEYVEENGIILLGQYIASKYNKDSNSTKFWDYASKQKFNYDIKSNRAIDFERAEPLVAYPLFYRELVEALQTYGEDHYPSEFGYAVIPVSGEEVVVVLIGQKTNPENFYTGRWKSVYTFNSARHTIGSVKLDIHYYEDGNVRLNFEENIDQSTASFDASSIVNFINNTENKLTFKVIEEFNTLNKNTFKYLRRLLPVTKSKINWGKAIGTYKLGTDVVNQ